MNYVNFILGNIHDKFQFTIKTFTNNQIIRLAHKFLQYNDNIQSNSKKLYFYPIYISLYKLRSNS